jgi:hypothetical protein
LRFVHAITQGVKRGVRQAWAAIFKALCTIITATEATGISARITTRIWPTITKATRLFVAEATGLLIAKFAITTITAALVAKAARFWFGRCTELGAWAVITAAGHNWLGRCLGWRSRCGCGGLFGISSRR